MNIENLFLFGVDVLKTVVKGTANTILAQVGDAVQQVTEGDLAEWWQHVGFMSRPPKPVAGRQAAQVLGIRRRDRDVIFASRDLRGQELAGTLADGETCIYAPGELGEAQARMLMKADGSINFYTRVGNTASGAGMSVILNPTTNTVSAINGLGFGFIADPNGTKMTAGDAAISVNADGTIKITGKGQVQIDGTTIVLGSTVLPVVSAALKGPTGIAGVASLKTLIE